MNSLFLKQTENENDNIYKMMNIQRNPPPQMNTSLYNTKLTPTNYSFENVYPTMAYFPHFGSQSVVPGIYPSVNLGNMNSNAPIQNNIFKDTKTDQNVSELGKAAQGNSPQGVTYSDPVKKEA